jgi:hypothetical protein
LALQHEVYGRQHGKICTAMKVVNSNMEMYGHVRRDETATLQTGVLKHLGYDVEHDLLTNLFMQHSELLLQN